LRQIPVDPVARRLIMVVSDCVSGGWWKGKIPALLAEWSRRAPVVLAHLLPERRWGNTAVGEATSWLWAGLPGLANRDLIVELPWWDEAPLGTRVALPVMPLEAGASNGGRAC
jgi:hypothetical protein